MISLRCIFGSFYSLIFTLRGLLVLPDSPLIRFNQISQFSKLFSINRSAVLVIMSLMLFHCQSFKGNHPETTVANTNGWSSWERYREKLSQVNNWHLDAKLGFVYQQNNKQKAVNTRLNWQQNMADFEIVISGALGFGRTVIDSSSDRTRLTTHRGEQFSAASPEALFFQHTGINLPWSNLSWWIRGLPAPNEAYKKTFMNSQTFQLKTLQQSGWLVEYLDYQTSSMEIPSVEVSEGEQPLQLALPQKISFKKGHMRAKIIVRNWRLTPENLKLES